MQAGARNSGHAVQGHVDNMGTVLRKRPVVRAPLDTAGRFGLPAGEISRFGRWGF